MDDGIQLRGGRQLPPRLLPERSNSLQDDTDVIIAVNTDNNPLPNENDFVDGEDLNGEVQLSAGGDGIAKSWAEEMEGDAAINIDKSLSGDFAGAVRAEERNARRLSQVHDLIPSSRHEQVMSRSQGDVAMATRGRGRGHEVHTVSPRSQLRDEMFLRRPGRPSVARAGRYRESSPSPLRSRSHVTFREGPSDTSLSSVSSFIQRSAVDPEKYDGTTSLKTYLKKFERVAQWNKWTSVDKAFQLTINLKGSAALCIKTLRDEQYDDYGAIVSKLKDSFGCNETDWLDKFVNSTRHKSESLIDFANNLRYLGSKAFPDGVQDSTLVKKFIRGCGDSKLADFLFVQQPVDLSEVMRFVLKYQDFQKVEKPRKPDPVYSVAESPVNIIETRKEGLSTAEMFKSIKDCVDKNLKKTEEGMEQIRKTMREVKECQNKFSKEIDQLKNPVFGPNPNFRGNGRHQSFQNPNRNFDSRNPQDNWRNRNYNRSSGPQNNGPRNFGQNPNYSGPTPSTPRYGSPNSAGQGQNLASQGRNSAQGQNSAQVNLN